MSAINGLTTSGIMASQFDPDAVAFINAAALTSMTDKYAINNLVTGLKNKSLWGKMKAIYPFAGTTATTHKFNLKNPADTDAAFRLVFSGGWTHSANGALPNGTNAFADTKFIPSTESNLDNTHFSVYSRSNVAGAFQAELGCDQGDNTRMLIILKWSTNNLFADLWRVTQRVTVNMSSIDTTGLFTVSRTASNLVTVYRNGSSLGTNTSTTAGSRPTIAPYLGANNQSGTAVNFSAKQLAFATIGDSLSASESTDFYNIVQAYQTALSRNV